MGYGTVVTLSSGETCTFLEDGDEVILHYRCRREGQPSLGFGECRGVLPSPAGLLRSPLQSAGVRMTPLRTSRQ